MSANIKSLIIGVVMLVGGLILWKTGAGVEIPIFSLDKVGIVLAILGAIEIVITGSVMIFPSKNNKKLDR